MLLIFILFNRNNSIIKDFGLVSYISITIGFLIKNDSSYYTMKDSLKSCYQDTVFSFIGFVLIFIPFSIKIIVSSTYALKFNNSKRDLILMSNIFSFPIFKCMFLTTKETQAKYNNLKSSSENPHMIASSSMKTITKRMNSESKSHGLNASQKYNSSTILNQKGHKRNISADDPDKTIYNVNNDTGFKDGLKMNSKFSTINNAKLKESQNNFISSNKLNILKSEELLGKNKNFSNDSISNYNLNEGSSSTNLLSRMSRSKSEMQILKRDISKSDMKINELNSKRYNSSSSLKPSDSVSDISPQNKFETMVSVTYLEIMVLLSLFLILIVLLVIYVFVINKKEMKEEQMFNGLYAYVCPATNIPIAINVMEFILLLFIIFKFKVILSGRYIYIENKIICLIAIIWITLDPGMKVKK